MNKNYGDLFLGRSDGVYLYEDTKSFLIKGESKSNEERLIEEKFELLFEDNNFNKYIEQLKKDGQDINNRNQEIAHKDISGVLKRSGTAQFKGEDNRKDVQKSDNERYVEWKIFKKYENDDSKTIGICKYYQSPIARELADHRNIDLVFSDDNNVYICELKRENNESIFKAISEILTYYFCINERRKEFIECFANKQEKIDKYDIIPCILIPSIKVKQIINYVDILKNKLKEYNILFEVLYYDKNTLEIEILR